MARNETPLLNTRKVTLAPSWTDHLCFPKLVPEEIKVDGDTYHTDHSCKAHKKAKNVPGCYFTTPPQWRQMSHRHAMKRGKQRQVFHDNCWFIGDSLLGNILGVQGLGSQWFTRVPVDPTSPQRSHYPSQKAWKAQSWCLVCSLPRLDLPVTKKETRQHSPTSYNGMWDPPWETGGRATDRAMVREEAAEPAEVVSTWQTSQKGSSLDFWTVKVSG